MYNVHGETRNPFSAEKRMALERKGSLQDEVQEAREEEEEEEKEEKEKEYSGGQRGRKWWPSPRGVRGAMK